MGGIYCCVPGCKNNSNVNKNVSWHLFPGDKKMKEEWVTIINRRNSDGSLWYPNYFHRICGKHFNLSGKKQINNKYPIYFYEGNSLQNQKDINFHYDLELGRNLTIDENVEPPLLICDIKTEDLTSDDDDIQTEDHTYARNEDTCEILRQQIIKQNEIIEEKNRLLQSQSLKINLLESKCKHIQKKYNNRNNNFISRIKEDMTLLRFYTGFANITRFEIFQNFIKPGYSLAKTMTYKNNSSSPNDSKLNFEEQCILVLMRLRLGSLEQELADKFNISVATVSRIWIFWLNLLSSQMSQVKVWPSKNVVQKHMPNSFKTLYPNTRVILYRTEIFIEIPSNVTIPSSTNYQHKSQNTAKGLIGLTPNGFVSFVSDIYPGKTKDKDIVKNCGILDFLEAGDEVMADREFNIKEILNEIKVTLNIAPFLRKNQEDEESREIAKLRIHVERVIRHVKTFRILRNVFSSSMHDKLNQIWKICCLLLNFIDEPSLEN